MPADPAQAVARQLAERALEWWLTDCQSCADLCEQTEGEDGYDEDNPPMCQRCERETARAAVIIARALTYARRAALEEAATVVEGLSDGCHPNLVYIPKAAATLRQRAAADDGGK